MNATSSKYIEILDIDNNKITEKIPINRVAQLESEKFIQTINNVVKKFKPIPDNGYMIKIPLEPSVHLENEWVNTLINEVIVIIPKGEEPYLLLFDDENNTYFFSFKASIEKLLNNFDISI